MMIVVQFNNLVTYNFWTARSMDDRFNCFFSGNARDFLLRGIDLALDEDGPDLTAEAVFAPRDRLVAAIVAKEDTLVAGLPIAPLVIERMGAADQCAATFPVDEGSRVRAGTVVAELEGPAVVLLKAERIILNYICRLSGVANLAAAYVRAVAGTTTTILDTRKTLPGLRYPDKYAVLVGGARNHRMDLAKMLMLKDNHLDRAGGVAPAMRRIRKIHPADSPASPPVEIECRTLDEVREAVAAAPARIMLDNMGRDDLTTALGMIPENIESEISGGVDLAKVADLAKLGPDFISIGRITHSAPSADFSMRLAPKTPS